MTSVTLHLIDHTDPAVPEYLRHSFALALAEKVAHRELAGLTKGEQPLEDGSPHVIPGTFVFRTPEAEAWLSEWLTTMNALTLPDVASVEAVQAIPYVTPSLLMHLIHKEQNPKKPVRPPRPARPAARTPAAPDAPKATPDAQSSAAPAPQGGEQDKPAAQPDAVAPDAPGQDPPHQLSA